MSNFQNGDKLQEFTKVWTVVNVGLSTVTIEEHNGSREHVSADSLAKLVDDPKRHFVHFRGNQKVARAKRRAS